jgi:Holliday junction DNA helicase RuvA
MYDHLVGEVTEKAGSRAVLRTGGVGYELKVSLTTASQLQVGGQATLYTILNVVDGTPSLLGFASRTERELARRLLSTSGVGPSIVLSILSVYSPREVAGVIQSSDVQALKRVKGVGQKTAERLCLELRDVVGKLDLGDGGTADTAKQATVDQEAEDAVLALVTLGYSEKEARSKLEKVVERAPGLKTEELVRAVLQS